MILYVSICLSACIIYILHDAYVALLMNPFHRLPGARPQI